MPRKSDTAERVLEAADKLLQQGVRPTQQNVREELGSGSISTINKALNVWWRQLGARISEKQQRPDLPEPVVESANRLWQQALGYAEHAFAERKEEMDRYYENFSRQAEQGRHEAIEELNELRAQNARLLSDRERTGDDKQALQQQVVMLESQVIRLTSERDNLAREVKQQALLLDAGPTSAAVPQLNTQELIELKVTKRLGEEECARQGQIIDRLTDENALLRKQLLDEERLSVNKCHALETVIAQQDVRYDQSLSELNECRQRLATMFDQ